MAGTSRTTGSRIRARVARLAVIGGIAALSSVLAPGTASAASGVDPVIDCYTLHADRSRTLVLGYTNSGSSTRVIGHGAGNVMQPSYLQGTQPTSFAAGRVHAAFTLRLSEAELGNGAHWTLDGHRLNFNVAVALSPQCPPTTQLPADGNGTGTAVALGAAGVFGAAALYRFRRRLARLADGSATAGA